MRTPTPLRREFLLIHHLMYQATLRRARILNSQEMSRYARLPAGHHHLSSDQRLCANRIRRLATVPLSHTLVRELSHKGQRTGMVPTAVGSAGMPSSPCPLYNAQRALINIPGSLRWMTRDMPEDQDVHVAQHRPSFSSMAQMIVKN
jgi:hypothetical protein